MGTSEEFTGLWPTPSANDHMPQSPLPETMNVLMGRPSRRMKEAIQQVKPAPIASHQQMSLLGDSLASLSVLPGSDAARKMTAGCGQKCSGLCVNSGPLGLLVKTLLESLEWTNQAVFLNWKIRPLKKVTYRRKASLGESAQTWNPSVTQSSRFLYQLAVSTPPTDVTGCSLWGTPRSSEYKGCGPVGTRSQAIWLGKEYLTAQVLQAETNRGAVDSLTAVIKLWPTPQSGADNEAAHGAMSGDFKAKFCERAGIPVTAQLNPEWVEWLMGFPNGWLNLTSPGSAGTSRTG